MLTSCSSGGCFQSRLDPSRPQSGQRGRRIGKVDHASPGEFRNTLVGIEDVPAGMRGSRREEALRSVALAAVSPQLANPRPTRGRRGDSRHNMVLAFSHASTECSCR